MSIDENPSSPQSAINVTTKKKMNPQAKAFLFHKNKICTVSTPTTMGYG